MLLSTGDILENKIDQILAIMEHIFLLSVPSESRDFNNIQYFMFPKEMPLNRYSKVTKILRN